MEFFSFLIQNEVAFVWVLVRVASLMVVIPIIGGFGVPPLIKVALIFVVSLAIFPFARILPQPLETPPLAAGLVGEIMMGLVLGLGFRLVFAAVDLAAEVEGFQMGFGIGNVFNPLLGQDVSLIGQLRGLVAILIFFAVNAHHTIFEVLVYSFRRVPPLSFTTSPHLFEHMMRLVAEMFALGVRIAVPVTLVLILSNIAFGVLSRIVPQMNILLFSFPVTTAVGLFVLGASLSLFAELIRGRMGDLGGVTLDLLEGMRPP